jgi:hypothetical protein
MLIGKELVLLNYWSDCGIHCWSGRSICFVSIRNSGVGVINNTRLIAVGYRCVQKSRV